MTAADDAATTYVESDDGSSSEQSDEVSHVHETDAVIHQRASEEPLLDVDAHSSPPATPCGDCSVLSATSCEDSPRFLQSGRSLLQFVPPHMRVGYAQLEKRIEARFLKFFHFVQDDLRENTNLLFMVGVVAGGVLGSRCGAWGMGFGISVFKFDFLQYFHALILIVLMLEALTTTSDFSTLGCYQMGMTSFHVLETRRMNAPNASLLTLGCMTCVSPSLYLGFMIMMKSWYDAFRLLA